MHSTVINDSSKSLSQVLKDLADYNREHHTHISYGQYVILMDKEKNKNSGQSSIWVTEHQE